MINMPNKYSLMMMKIWIQIRFNNNNNYKKARFIILMKILNFI